MAKRVVSCRASDDVRAAEEAMRQAQVHRLPVTDASEHLVGVLSLADIARATARGRPAEVTPVEVGETLAAISQVARDLHGPGALETENAHRLSARRWALSSEAGWELAQLFGCCTTISTRRFC